MKFEEKSIVGLANVTAGGILQRIQVILRFHLLEKGFHMPGVRYTVTIPKSKRRIQFSPENLRLFRYRYCITQRALSSILDVYPSAISVWELGRGYPGESQILDIERLLNLDENEIRSFLSVRAPECLDDISRTKLSKETVRRFCKKNSITLRGLACLLEIHGNTIELWGSGQYPSAEHYNALKSLMELPKDELKAKIASTVPAELRIRKKDKRIPKLVAGVRKKYQISQRELALLLNVITTSIAFWENGRNYPTEEHIAAIRNLAKLGKRKVNALLAEKASAESTSCPTSRK